MTRTAIVIIAVLLLCAACAMQPGPIAATASAFIVALDQMLASGAITADQYAALRAGFEQAGRGSWSAENIGTTVGTSALAAWLAYLRAKQGAVNKVMELRGPTEDERRAMKGAS